MADLMSSDVGDGSGQSAAYYFSKGTRRVIKGDQSPPKKGKEIRSGSTRVWELFLAAYV